MPSPILPSSSSFSPPPQIDAAQALDQKVETLLRGRYVSAAAETFVEDYLKDNHFEALLVHTRELALLAEAQGFDVSLRFCTSKELGHPVPLLTIRTQDGEYAVPSINQVWDPVIPLERGIGESKERQTLAAEEIEDSEMQAKLGSSVLAFETFAKGRPVQVAIIPSDSSEVSVQALPFFSEGALDDARQHAAERIVEGASSYSYILDEVVCPAVRECIREESALFGKRERPELVDAGTDGKGSVFECITYVPMAESTDELPIRGVVYQDGLSLKMRFLS